MTRSRSPCRPSIGGSRARHYPGMKTLRHPAVAARELASIDLLSEGRLEIGLGAGWKRLDYDHSGIAMDPPKVRVDRLIEHTQVIKGLFADGPFRFAAVW